jgi:cytochrome c oxidase assembly protein subunit 15
MRGHDLFRYVAIAACVFCYVTILLGGNVMASDSGLACPDWPTCHGTLLPPLTGSTGIEWSHRVAAFVLSASIGTLMLLAVAFERRRPVVLRLSAIAFGAVVGQALLGGWVVVSGLTVGIVLLHLALATALFAVLLVLVLLANLREVPRRWLDWALRATDEREPTDDELWGSPAPTADGARV